MPVMPCGSNNALHFCVAPTEESSREGDEVKVIKEVNLSHLYYVCGHYVN